MTELSNRTRRYALRTGIILSLLLWLAPSAVCAPRNSVGTAKYRPPKTPSAPRDTGTNTTRGGSCSDSFVGLTPLVPLSHIGQTISLRPTFIWFVPDRQSYLLQFRLFRSNGQPLYRTQMQSQPGLMQFSLPKEQPELAIGQSYIWQVALICDPSTPSMNVVARANIAIVKPTATLQSQLDAAQSPQQRIDLYAESGLWYDALAEARKSSQPAVLDLLDSLASSEARSERSWSDRLKQIEAALTVSAK